MLTALTSAQSDQQADLQQFNVSATPAQLAFYNRTVSGLLGDLASHYEAQAIDFATTGQALSIAPNTATQVIGAFTNGPLDEMRVVEARLVSDTISRATSLRNKAIVTASGVGAAVLIVLLLALLLTTVVGRSMVRPLRRLRVRRARGGRRPAARDGPPDERLGRGRGSVRDRADRR